MRYDIAHPGYGSYGEPGRRPTTDVSCFETERILGECTTCTTCSYMYNMKHAHNMYLYTCHVLLYMYT